MTRYRVGAYSGIQESEQAYQNAADRLADVKRHESISLLKRAKVQFMSCNEKKSE